MTRNTKLKITAMYERTCEPNAENIRRQKNNLTNIANRYNFRNIQHFTDDGYACTDKNRPGFTALMNAIRADQVSTLIIRDCTRLTRNCKVQSDLMNELDLHGVRLLSMNEKMDRLPLHVHSDDNDLDYELHGDYYIPMIIAPESDQAPVTSKWADMYMNYLKKFKPGRFNKLVATGKLHSHLAEIDKQARNQAEWNVLQEIVLC